MKFMPKRGLLLIIIPAVLMAMEQGEEEARLSELRVVQAAVISMMVENDLRWFPQPVVEPTGDMSAFPDASTSPLTKNLGLLDKLGYVLYGHDVVPDDSSLGSLNYISAPSTDWTYTANRDGSVAQGPHR
jgi:hypothetical protein